MFKSYVHLRMSIPQNHHHVSQCQIKNFINSEGKIFLYDKAKKNFYVKSTSKNIFSEKRANSIYKDGKIDHESLELDLKSYEDKYPDAVCLISEAIKNRKISDDCHRALILITMFGIIGRLRTPQRKRELDTIIDNSFTQFEDLLAEDQKKGLEQTREYKQHVKYSNLLTYTEIADSVFERMGGLDFTIWHIESNDCFLLPDTSATSIRKKINLYFNPDIKEIAEVGFPLTDKIFVHALSKKLGQQKSYICFIDKDDDKNVTDINYNLYNFANNTVATSNEGYLRRIVSTIKNWKV